MKHSKKICEEAPIPTLAAQTNTDLKIKDLRIKIRIYSLPNKKQE